MARSPQRLRAFFLPRRASHGILAKFGHAMHRYRKYLLVLIATTLWFNPLLAAAAAWSQTGPVAMQMSAVHCHDAAPRSEHQQPTERACCKHGPCDCAQLGAAIVASDVHASRLPVPDAAALRDVMALRSVSLPRFLRPPIR